ncbi:hypothetical protein EIMP300_09660 [Escherichia coli]|uniref:Phosphatase n=1 Tax=Escherichia coli TaxID=562 RepID=A0A8S0FGA8_ECOLX|nr:hypothetical protein EIMP300_09660 [Escherichia coli]
MSQIEAVFFDCDGTLVDSEVICSRAYVTMFREFGIHVDLEEIFTRFKGVKLYEIINIISKEQGVTMIQADAEHVYRAEVARLFDSELEVIAGANELLASVKVPITSASSLTARSARCSIRLVSSTCCTTSRKNCSAAMISSVGSPIRH